MDKQELDHIQAERRNYLTVGWISRLLRGKQSVGDTFWVGHFGVALVVVPVTMMLLILVSMIARDLIRAFLAAFAAFELLYNAALTRALWIAIRRQTGASNWKWVGLALTAASVATSALYLLILLEAHLLT